MILWIVILSVLIIGGNSAIRMNLAFIMNRKKGSKMTKREYDFIGGLNMTGQITNDVFKEIMAVAEDDPLDQIRADIQDIVPYKQTYLDKADVLHIIDKYAKGESE